MNIKNIVRISIVVFYLALNPLQAMTYSVFSTPMGCLLLGIISLCPCLFVNQTQVQNQNQVQNQIQNLNQAQNQIQNLNPVQNQAQNQNQVQNPAQNQNQGQILIQVPHVLFTLSSM